MTACGGGAVAHVRHKILSERTSDWWSDEASFFDITRSRAGVFLRRLNHSAHHRGQLTVYLRLLGRPVYSIYGPTADTGGLFLQHAPTLYRYKSLDHLLTAEGQGASGRSFPGQARLLPRSVRRLSEDAGYPTRGGEQRRETRFWRWSWQRLS
ncbi:MAG: DinB family protein [Thermoanaerobaculia bacterium]